MPLKQSEAVVLRSYPLREADLLVTFFTRNEGKIRGVAKAAMKSRKRFGGALEPLTYVRVYYEDREKQELSRIDSCDVLQSPLTSPVDYPRAVALAHVAEVVDELMLDREVNDPVFRLAVAVLAHLPAGAIWMPRDVLRSVDDAAGGIFAGTGIVCGLRRATGRRTSILPCDGRRVDVHPTISGWRRRSCRRIRVNWRRRFFGLRWNV